MLFNSPSVHTYRVAKVRGQTVTVDAVLTEISLNGVVVISPKRASVGTRVEVFFEIPAKGYFRDLHILGFVEHFHAVDEGYLLGIRFEETSAELSAFIQDFIDYKNRLHELGKQIHHPPENP